MSTSHRIEVQRERFKFSCAHMTVFPDGSKERLHGHNYYLGVAVELSDISFANMLAFAPLKDAIKSLCDAWRERVLIATCNPYFELVRDTEEELEFRLCGDRYVMPRRDALLLPIDNAAVEPLAAYAGQILVDSLAEVLPHGIATVLEVRLHESPGQGAICRYQLAAKS